MNARYAILVVWSDGDEEYLRSGPNMALFSARSRAEEQVEFMKMGMDGDPDVQSINVVRAPAAPRKRRSKTALLGASEDRSNG